MIISLVVILVALVIAFNFEKFTGQATTKMTSTKLYLSTDPEIADQGEVTLNKGDILYITVDPGTKGSYGIVTIYDVNSVRERRIQTVELQNCATKQCKPGVIGTATQNIYYNWEGRYCARVKDLGTKKEVQSCFTVR